MGWITDNRFDDGKSFDFGRTSESYAKYRDIYPEEFYKRIVERGLCIKGQSVLDIGTGTGVLPRNIYAYGANFVGTDISAEQIEQAKALAYKQNMKIDFIVSAAEKLPFPNNSFDVVTACQCWAYFDYNIVLPKLASILKPDGRLVILYMAWLPQEDKIASESERLVLKYNPKWTGCNEIRRSIALPEVIGKYFEKEDELIYDLPVDFTRESWNGRMKTCRGVGASLGETEIEKWEAEHKNLLEKIAPNNFSILHYVAMTVLKVKK